MKSKRKLYLFVLGVVILMFAGSVWVATLSGMRGRSRTIDAAASWGANIVGGENAPRLNLLDVRSQQSADNSFDRRESIFVSIASFRDLECPPTILDMFEKAKHPRALFVGIIEQNERGDPSCIPPSFASCGEAAFCPTDNIRIRRVPARDARGPTFGRYVSMLMYQGEKYYMMIDSHNRFATHWDAKLIKNYLELPSKKAVISAYPNAWMNDSKSLDNHAYVTYMCNAHFLDDGFLRLGGLSISKGPSRLHPYAAAGFLFADAQLVKEVPFDPYLDYIFDGEEITYTIRMWTHGWDIYSPAENVIFHYYYRTGAERVWSVPGNNWYPKQRQSVRRIQYILGSTYPNSTQRIVALDTKDEMMLRDIEKYGLGKERTIEEYYRFAVVDPVHRVANMTFCNRGLYGHD